MPAMKEWMRLPRLPSGGSQWQFSCHCEERKRRSNLFWDCHGLSWGEPSQWQRHRLLKIRDCHASLREAWQWQGGRCHARLRRARIYWYKL